MMSKKSNAHTIQFFHLFVNLYDNDTELITFARYNTLIILHIKLRFSSFHFVWLYILKYVHLWPVEWRKNTYK